MVRYSTGSVNYLSYNEVCANAANCSHGLVNDYQTMLLTSNTRVLIYLGIFISAVGHGWAPDAKPIEHFTNCFFSHSLDELQLGLLCGCSANVSGILSRQSLSLRILVWKGPRSFQRTVPWLPHHVSDFAGFHPKWPFKRKDHVPAEPLSTHLQSLESKAFDHLQTNCQLSKQDIAPIISTFKLASFFLVNLTCFHASYINSPSFRPSFRYYNKWLSLIVGLFCLVFMFFIHFVR